MFKKEFFILFLLVSSFINAQTEIKVNLASALLLVPNIGIEVQLSEKLGYQLDTSASFFDNIEGSPFQTIQSSIRLEKKQSNIGFPNFPQNKHAYGLCNFQI